MKHLLNDVELDRFNNFYYIHQKCYQKAYDKAEFRLKLTPRFLRIPIDLPTLIISCHLNNGIGPAYDVICPHCKSKQSITDYTCW
jgi:hypothetical protein